MYQKIQPCDICGDVGIAEVIAVCSECHKSREHIYCMHPNLCSIPESWSCEACRAVKSEGMVETLVHKDHACSAESVDKVVCWEEYGASMSKTSFKFGEEDLPNPPAVVPFWKGSFEILNFPRELYDGFQAYRAQKVSSVACFVPKQMPRVLQLVLQPRVDVWPDIFQTYSTAASDISVYFWVDDFCRDKYNCLLELMEKRDLSMQSCLDGTKLLIFTSRQLPAEYQRMNEKLYLWGIFLSLEGCKSSCDFKEKQQVNSFPLLSCKLDDDSVTVENEDDDQTEDMEIDMVGANEVGVVDGCLRNNFRNACSDNVDVPSEDALAKIHSDQPCEKIIVECHLHHKEGDQGNNCDTPEFSRTFSSDAPDAEQSAVSLVKVSQVANKAGCANKLEQRDSSWKGLAKCSKPPDGGMHIVVADPIIQSVKNVEKERDEMICMVCRKGYSLRPKDMLGIYCHGTRVNLGTGTSGNSDGIRVYSTVTQFNAVHFQCHREAKRADASCKKPKKEWQGAKVRNNGTFCNCIFPLKGPFVPELQYVRYVGEYWDNLNALGQVDGKRLQLLIYDIILMLTRFSTSTPFSTDEKGGGRDGNLRFLPFMMQMAQYLLDQGGTARRLSMTKTVSSYLACSTGSKASTSSSVPPLCKTKNTFQFMMVTSLLTESYEMWLDHRKVFLQHGISEAYMQHMNGEFMFRLASDPPLASTYKTKLKTGNTSEIMDAEMDDNNLFVIIRPTLVYTGLIEQLQRFFKLNVSSHAIDVKTDKSIGPTGLKDWEVVMKEKLVNENEMLGFSKKLLLWLKEMNSAADLQEAINVMEVSSDILSCGFSEYADFVQAAIEIGKNRR